MFPQLIAVLLIFSNVAYLEAVERIVNGTPVNAREVPYQVALKIGNNMCGGSIVHSEFILTAAHCTDGKTPGNILFAVGLTDYRNFSNYKPIKKLFQHPKFNNISLLNDIALLEVYSSDLSSPGALIRIIPISDRTPRTGDKAVVSGYGRINYGGEISYLLRIADVKIYSFYDCYKLYGDARIAETMICASEINGDIVKDSCQGDSGGPLVSNKKLVGIVSFGYGCGDKNFPGVYTDVTKFLDWIKLTTQILKYSNSSKNFKR